MDLKTQLLSRLASLPDHAIYDGYAMSYRGVADYLRICNHREFKTVLLAEKKTWEDDSQTFVDCSTLYFKFHKEHGFEEAGSIVSAAVTNGYCDHLWWSLRSCSQRELMDIVKDCDSVRYHNLDLSDFVPASNFIVNAEDPWLRIYNYLTADTRVIQCSVERLDAKSNMCRVHILYKTVMTKDDVREHFSVYCLHDDEREPDITVHESWDYPIHDPDGFNFKQDYEKYEGMHAGQGLIMQCVRCCPYWCL
jgi:hypothetical protein